MTVQFGSFSPAPNSLPRTQRGTRYGRKILLLQPEEVQFGPFKITTDLCSFQFPAPKYLAEALPKRCKKDACRAQLIANHQPSSLSAISLSTQCDAVPVITGLLNPDNRCFMNAVLQCLLSSSSFLGLLLDVGYVGVPPTCPLFNSILTFLSTLQYLDARSSPEEYWASVSTARPLLVEADDVLRCFRSRSSSHNDFAQEDAHEFLEFLLDSLHNELLSALPKSKKKQCRNKAEAEEWQEVGRNKKTSTVLIVEREQSLFTNLFGTQVRTIVKRTSQKPSITFQPYLSLALDIASSDVMSLLDAFNLFFSPEKIEDDQYLSVSKEQFIEAPPSVLILHLKRFAYSNSQIVKIFKRISFPFHLRLPQSCFFHSGASKQREYKLVGVVQHHGSLTSGGHYTSFVFSKVLQCWLFVDDTKVIKVSESRVSQAEAYLLFYEED